MIRSAETISASLKKVPPFPPVAVKLLSLLSNPSVDTNEVADLIGGDASFTARLLQRVNSAQFSFVSDITSVRRAVALLGIDTTRQIIMAHATAAYTQGALRIETMRRCWQHTVATGVLADEIAEACGEYTNVAFTAGIMHDIGRLGLLVAYPDEYERVVRDAAARSLDVLDFEAEEFGAHHAEAGRMLAERWELPAEMHLIAGRHHDPCEGTELTLLRIVHVACRLADVLGYDVVKPLRELSVQEVIAELPEQARARLNRRPEEFCERIEQKLREFGSETADVPPEEALALLSPASPETPELDESPDLRDSLELEALQEQVSEPSARKWSKWQIIVGIAVGLAALGAAAFWAFR
jgi:HD-like signal output (HDOD) protein